MFVLACVFTCSAPLYKHTMITTSHVILFQYSNDTVLLHPTVHSLIYWLVTVTVALAATLCKLIMNTNNKSLHNGEKRIWNDIINLCTLLEKMRVKNTSKYIGYCMEIHVYWRQNTKWHAVYESAVLDTHKNTFAFVMNVELEIIISNLN